MAASLGDEGLERLRQRLAGSRAHVTSRLSPGRDFGDAVIVFLLVVLSTFPLVVPFMLTDDTARALLWSRLVAVGMLFLAGATLARYSGGNTWLNGLIMAALGAALMAAIMALGRMTGMTPYVTFGHFRVPAARMNHRRPRRAHINATFGRQRCRTDRRQRTGGGLYETAARTFPSRPGSRTQALREAGVFPASSARSTGPAPKCSTRLERPGSEESLRAEYGALRLRLEGELLRHIAEQSSRAGTAHS